MIEQRADINGEERHEFAELSPEQYERGADWLSHEPVSYETASRPEDGQTWFTLIMPTAEQLAAFRDVLS